MTSSNLNLALTVGCELSCVYCNCRHFGESGSPTMAPDVARRVIRSFRRDGFEELSFFGGEPTLHPQLADSIAWAKELGYEQIALTSNGLRLENPGLARGLISAGLGRCLVTLSSQDAAIEDALCGESGTHRRKLRGLESILAAARDSSCPPSIGVNLLLAKPTLPRLSATLRWLYGIGVREFGLDFVWPMARIVRNQSFVPRYREAANILLDVLYWAEVNPSIQLRCTGFPPCMLRWAKDEDRPDVKRLRDRYLVESVVRSIIVWPTEARIDWMAWCRALKTQGPACRACPWSASCSGVWKSYARLYGLSELPEPSVRCGRTTQTMNETICDGQGGRS